MRQQRHIGVYVIVADGGRLLLIEKARGHYTGRLDLPGGSIEFGESTEECACREVREETGLTVAGLELIGVWSHVGTYGDEQLHHIGIIYRARSWTGELSRGGDGQDSNGPVWHDNHESSLTPLASQAFDFLSSRAHGD